MHIELSCRLGNVQIIGEKDIDRLHGLLIEFLRDPVSVHFRKEFPAGLHRYLRQKPAKPQPVIGDDGHIAVKDPAHGEGKFTFPVYVRDLRKAFHHSGKCDSYTRHRLRIQHIDDRPGHILTVLPPVSGRSCQKKGYFFPIDPGCHVPRSGQEHLPEDRIDVLPSLSFRLDQIEHTGCLFTDVEARSPLVDLIVRQLSPEQIREIRGYTVLLFPCSCDQLQLLYDLAGIRIVIHLDGQPEPGDPAKFVDRALQLFFVRH